MRSRPAARAIGAVNTILVEEETGRLLGHNTDWRGFLADLDGPQTLPLPGATVLSLARADQRALLSMVCSQAGARIAFARPTC